RHAQRARLRRRRGLPRAHPAAPVTASTLGAGLPLSLIVFAFNEATNVPLVLPEIVTWLQRRGAPFELVFVDDGSTDGTAAAARAVFANTGLSDREGQVLRHERNRGIGAALKSGVRAARLPWVTFLPCDGQIAPGELDTLLNAAEQEGVALVFSVYRDRDDGWQRTLLSAAIRGLIQGLFGVYMRSDGPYLFRRELFDPDLLVPDTFFLNFEFPIRVLRAGKPHQVVAIHCQRRRTGQSKSTGIRRILGVARDLVGFRMRLPRSSSLR
ncbi:MAG TPA: glycosyltransferase family 2 protein, partial [Polyangia bacterium]